MASPDVESTNGSTHSYNDVDAVPLTLDERRRSALAEIDNAKFTWFHLKVSMVASMGMFTDAYDIFTITAVSTMLGFVYGYHPAPLSSNSTASSSSTLNATNAITQVYLDLNSRVLDNNADLGLKMATLTGAIFGQLVFGWLADIAGRKRMYGIELIIMIFSTFAQALAGESKTGKVSIISVLIVWRVLLGIGIGGDYPLSAIIVSEFSPIRIRGRLMTIVILFQGIGTFAAALVAFLVVLAFKSAISNPNLPLAEAQDPVDQMWRLLVGLGCIPAVIGLYFRFTVSETPRFTIDIERNLDQALADIDTSLSREDVSYDGEVIRRVAVPKASWKDFIHYFSKWENFRVLLGVSYSWFAIDAIFYGLNLNVFDLYGDNPFNVDGQCRGVWICEKLYNDSATSVIVASLASVPGYCLSLAFVDSWGRKPIQFMGFTVLGIIFIILGSALGSLKNAGRAGNNAITFLYCLACLFQNFGPNMSTFVIPGELFPTRYRSTCYGIAAASGKLGATISLVIFHSVADAAHLYIVLIVFGCFMLTGVGSTLWLPEPKGRSLESLSNETQRGFVEGYAGRRDKKDL